MIRKEGVHQFPNRVNIFLAVNLKRNSQAEIKEYGVTLWINGLMLVPSPLERCKDSMKQNMRALRTVRGM